MTYESKIDYWYVEWKEDEKDGNIKLAETCKQKYKQLVMDYIKKRSPYLLFIEKLEYLPPINLN